jgi:aryl-alcohol dehydrogenase-like predicted oxidoreductase
MGAEKTMEQRQLGRSGILVSALSLGSWMTYESMPESDALAVIRSGLEAGITFFDDARYDDRTGSAPIKTGYSEVLFGRLLRQAGCRREDVVIANKLWFEFFPNESIEAELDGSLRRLQMDHLDIVYCAARPESLPLVDLIGTLDRLIRSGKLRAWGVLNWSAQQMAEATSVATHNGLRPPSGAQLAYSALTRSPVEDDDMIRAASAGVGIVASYSLLGGLLTGKYRSRSDLSGRLTGQLDDARVRPFSSKIEPFVRVAADVGCTPSQLAIAYCLKNPLVSSVLFGARRVSQLQDNLGALEVARRLGDDQVARLSRL